MKQNITITIFGAESTGKTTLSRQLAKALGTKWTGEFARPYLEQIGSDITVNSMQAIWQGQKKLQQSAMPLHPITVIQDTDLFSTVGYWQLPHVQAMLGACPSQLIEDALTLKSDLYIITPSNIPFEQDPLRYGDDHRESTDNYWIAICEYFSLPYVVLRYSDKYERVSEALTFIKERSVAPCVAL